MNRYSGEIAFASNEYVEVVPGVFEPAETVVRKYIGDVLTNGRRYIASSNGSNDNIEITNKISIVSDPYARDNIEHILYVTFRGSKWKVVSLEVRYPRIELTLGGVYNGDE